MKLASWQKRWTSSESRTQLVFHLCLVGVKTERMKNRERKIGWKIAVFHCLVEERKQQRQKIGEKVFPHGPTFVILPNWEENEKGKVIRNAFYTNTPNLLYSPTPLTFPLLYNKDKIVNLYKLHFPSSPFSFQPNKKVFHPPTFAPLQPNIHEGKPNLFYPPTNFPSSHFSTPPTKRTPAEAEQPILRTLLKISNNNTPFR